MYNLAIRKCTSPPLLADEVDNFQMKIYYPAGDRTPDLLNQRQTCYHLSQRGELSQKNVITDKTTNSLRNESKFLRKLLNPLSSQFQKVFLERISN